MSNSYLSLIPSLSKDIIDLAIGEPLIIRNNFINLFDIKNSNIELKTDDFTYPNPNGYEPLISYLEDKYKGKIVITHGAKGGLAACFYALKKMGYNAFNMNMPWWTLIPPLAQTYGLNIFYIEKRSNNLQHYKPLYPELLLSPNNPNGFFESEADKLSDVHKKYNMPLIHDGAYYSHIYLDKSFKLESIGDVQIYSISKMLGLSSLRLGFVVCHNEQFYSLIKEYMEMVSVGVSVMPQMFLLDIFNKIETNQSLFSEFQELSRNQLIENKRLWKNINPNIMVIPDNVEEIPGMFLWAKLGPKANIIEESKIKIADGKYFGAPGYARINLAIPTNQLKQIIDNLNGKI